MNRPLVTMIEDDDAAPSGSPQPAGPTVIMLFNERSGPSQVIDLISGKHSFIESETWQTEDESGRTAWMLALTCETATADQLFEMIGSRLPDYIQVRRFPPSRLAHVRETGIRTDLSATE